MVLLVTGMHRSGTSAMAEMLIAGGLHPGAAERLMPPSASNQRGHFELIEFGRLNDELLAAAGGHWLDPPEPDAIRALIGTDHTRRARALIEALGEPDTLMVKDPRFCLTIPFWLDVLGADAECVVMHRHPAAVAASLTTRNGLDGRVGLHLWACYTLAAAAGLEGVDTHLVSYDLLLADPVAALTPLDRALDRFDLGAALERHTIEAALRHETGDEIDVPEVFVEVHELLERSVRLPSVSRLGADFVDATRSGAVLEPAVGLIGPLLRDIDRLQTDQRDLRDELREGAARHRAQLDWLETEASRMAEQLEHTRRDLGHYEQSRMGAGMRQIWRIKKGVREAAAQAKRAQEMVESARERVQALVPVTAPDHVTPRVSIVVPIQGSLRDTRRCLRSIVDASADVEYEIIVVDCRSTAAATEWLAKCRNVTVVAAPASSGRQRSIDAGVAVARGRLLCLLDGAVEVRPGWLAALVAAIDGDPSVGAVGAKLIGPDGRLRQAGGIVFDDGTTVGWGSGGDPAASGFGFTRRVDYCSIDCLVVDRELFCGIRGSRRADERLPRVVDDDVDLGFEVRRHGRTVVYQPACEVVHHGPDVEPQKISEQLIEKWHAELAGQPAPSPDPIAASWRDSPRHVVVFDHEVPAHDQASGCLRMRTILELLVERGHAVHFVPFNDHGRQPYTAELQQLGIHVLHDSAHSLVSELRRLHSLVDIVILSRPHVAERFLWLVRGVLPSAAIVYDMVDFHGLRVRRQAAQESPATSGDTLSAANRFEDLERRLFLHADHVLAITEDEAEQVRAIQPGVSISVLGNIHDPPRSEAPFGSRNGVLFVGSWNHEPNQDAIRWLLDEIMPKVWAAEPSLRLHLVGSNFPPEILATGEADERVAVHGWVQDLGEVFDRVRISVAPLRYGAGLKGKVGDSLARGVPVVATPIGAEGFGDVQDSLAVAESADDLAAAIIGLHDDESDWRVRREIGIDLVGRHFGPDAARSQLQEVVDRALPS